MAPLSRGLRSSLAPREPGAPGRRSLSLLCVACRLWTGILLGRGPLPDSPTGAVAISRFNLNPVPETDEDAGLRGPPRSPTRIRTPGQARPESHRLPVGHCYDHLFHFVCTEQRLVIPVSLASAWPGPSESHTCSSLCLQCPPPPTHLAGSSCLSLNTPIPALLGLLFCFLNKWNF